MYPYSEMLGEYPGLGEGLDPDEDPDRWLVVHRIGSRAAYQDMVAFVERVNDPGLQDRLEIAVSGKGAFEHVEHEGCGLRHGVRAAAGAPPSPRALQRGGSSPQRPDPLQHRWQS